MGKLLKYVIILLITVFAVGFFAWNLLPNFVASKLSDKAGVPIKIEHINFTFSSVGVDKFEVDNPKGSVLPKALEIDKTKVNIPIKHFFDQEIVIPEMRLSDIYISIEFDSKRSKNGNWTTIMGNLNSSLKRDTAGKESKRKVLIKKLILEDLDITLAYRDTGEVKKLSTIDRLELTNVSSEGGLPTAQLMNIIMKEALKDIFSREGLQNMLEDILKPEGGALDTLKGWFK